jgi:hypothetical protein
MWCAPDYVSGAGVECNRSWRRDEAIDQGRRYDIRPGLPGHLGAEAAASALARELTAMGAVAEVAGEGLVAAGTASTPVLSAVAAFIRARTSAGVLLDLSGPRPVVAAEPGLAPGSLETRRQHDPPTVQPGLSNQQIGYLLRAGLATTGR